MTDRGTSDSTTDGVPALDEALAEARSELDALRRSIAGARDLLDVAGRTEFLIHRTVQYTDTSGPPAESQPTPAGRPGWLSAAREWIRPRARDVEWTPDNARLWDVIAFVVILGVAAFVRLWDLGSLPGGMFSDEVIAGLEARRILDEGWIGVYSPAGGGSPTLFYYLVAPLVWLPGSDALPMRIVSAAVDLFTVAAFYVLLRRNLGYTSAITGTTFIGSTLVHLHIARGGLPIALWLLAVVLASIAMAEAARRGSPYWWGGAGALFAAGLYCYDDHLVLVGIALVVVVAAIFNWQAASLALALGGLILWPSNLAAVFVAITATLFAVSEAARDGRRWIRALSCSASFTLVIAPLARVIRDDPDLYFKYERQISLFRSEIWTANDSFADRTRMVLERYVDYWEGIAINPPGDAVSGLGAAPIVPIVALALALGGAVVPLLRRAGPLPPFAAAVVVLMPLVTVTSLDFSFQRSLVITPFIALLGSVAIAEFVRLFLARGHTWRMVGPVVAVLLVGYISFANLGGYFGKTAQSAAMQAAASEDLVLALDYVDGLSGHVYVYLFSDRYPFDHEIVRFLGDNLAGESRGRTFGANSLEFNSATGPEVVILMPEYQYQLDELLRLYPGGNVVASGASFGDSGLPAFVAYELPEVAATVARPRLAEAHLIHQENPQVPQ